MHELYLAGRLRGMASHGFAAAGLRSSLGGGPRRSSFPLNGLGRLGFGTLGR
jgi:hypothetical protein